VLGQIAARFTATPPLHDHVGALEWHSRIVEEAPQRLIRKVEREVRDDSERLARKRLQQQVALDDLNVAESPAQGSRGVRIEFDRDDARVAPDERRREHPAARAQVQDELAGADTGVLDDRVGDRCASEEVSCVSRPVDPRSARSYGHGRTPRSWGRSVPRLREL